jgi:cell division protein ZapA
VSQNGSVRVEIFDQSYNLRGSDGEYIQSLAAYVDTRMRQIAEQTATIDSLRLAVPAALNIADELHMLKRKHDTVTSDMKQRTTHLSGALDEVLQEARRAG